ncbi:structural maintenance of chromosome protein 4 [Trypanosoma cruzi]|nr:structural maintenance of chromosome protein 4 [Trypanosoma cruzi]
MAEGVPASTIPQPIFTGERRRVNSHTSLANLGRPRFPHPATLPSRSPASEEVSGSNEENPGFLEFVFNTWVPRSWNGGFVGILFEIRGAYDYWHRGEAHAQIAFDILVSWMRALQLYREPNKQFMDLGRIIPRLFRMQIVIKSDPSIPIQKLRARLHTAFHEDDTFARVAQPFMDRRGTRSQQQRSLLCHLCPIYGYKASTYKVRPKRGFPNYKQTSKNGKGAVRRL